MCCYREARDRYLLLVRTLLAIDGLALRAHHVGRLKRTLLLQCSAGQLLTLGVLGGESQVYTGYQVVETNVQSRLHGLLSLGAIALDGGRECAEAVQLHRLTLDNHLLQTAHDVLQHEHCHRIIYQLAMLTQVLGETLQVERILRVGLCVILAVSITSLAIIRLNLSLTIIGLVLTLLTQSPFDLAGPIAQSPILFVCGCKGGARRAQSNFYRIAEPQPTLAVHSSELHCKIKKFKPLFQILILDFAENRQKRPILTFYSDF